MIPKTAINAAIIVDRSGILLEEIDSKTKTHSETVASIEIIKMISPPCRAYTEATEPTEISDALCTNFNRSLLVKPRGGKMMM